MKKIYLDYAATTTTHPDVVESMKPYYSDIFGNPSSIHSFGQEAKAAVEEARQKVARMLNALPEEIVFTSGGTEYDNFALEGIAFAHKKKGNHIITSKIEHHAVLECCVFLEKQGFEITYLPVDNYGLVSPQDVKNAIKDTTILVSIMHANNEIGTIQPIEEIAKITAEKKIFFHTDAVQTAGHIPTDVKTLGVDLLSLSAHKFYGPKGIGVLFVKKGTKISPLHHGGAHEFGLRSGTLNVPSIVGLGKAIELLQTKEYKQNIEKIKKLRNKLIREVLKNIPQTTLNGSRENRVPGNANFRFKNIEGESIMLGLDFEGIYASTGSACASGSLKPSH